jgi:shikimate dehydrogenase
VTGNARAVCVIGWPIEHSRSPLIHNYWLSHYGIAGSYRNEAVPPDKFRDFVQSLAARGYAGANVTLPHKEAALQWSQPDERARAVGAANTLWLDGALRSTNTDVEGFSDNLDAAVPGWDRNLGRNLGRDLSKVVVLGAGGAARGVVYALLERGIAHIVAANRTASRAEALRERFGARVHPVAWSERNAVLGDAALVVNTTTLGMAGQPELSIDVGRLPGHAIVADLVYVPLETPLLRAAKARGLRTADGLGMLMHQAVRGFLLWFGKKPEVTAELRALLEADLDPSTGKAAGIT